MLQSFVNGLGFPLKNGPEIYSPNFYPPSRGMAFSIQQPDDLCAKLRTWWWHRHTRTTHLVSSPTSREIDSLKCWARSVLLISGVLMGINFTDWFTSELKFVEDSLVVEYFNYNVMKFLFSWDISFFCVKFKLLT